MIDLHCHLLPGIDDGPGTLEDAVALCRIAVADGITHAIVTPHIHPGRWSNSRWSIARDCRALQASLDEQGVDLRLGFAAEVRITDQLMKQVENDEIPCYGIVEGYRIMLLEFPHGQIIPGSDKLAQWLLARNIRPLIAHPERNRQLMKDPAGLEPFLALGCWLQLTAGAVTGGFGDRARAVALRLLEEDLVAVVASDGHNARARQPALGQAFDLIARRFGQDRARRLLLENPATIAADQFRERAIASCEADAQ